MAFGTPTLTVAGLAAINTVLAGGHVLQVTGSKFGSGFPAGADVPANFTGLKNYVVDGTNTSANSLTLYQTSIRTQISSAAIPFTFQINEIGIYASLDGAAPFLYAYLSTGSATGDTLTPSGASNAVIKSYAVVVKYTTNVPVSTTITLTSVVDLHAVSHLHAGVDPLPVATATETGVVPITPNDATKVLRGGSPASWGALPLHAPTHLDNGTDVIPTSTTARTGLLPKLSGDVTTLLTGIGTWASARMAGEVVEYAGIAAPAGWLLCDGQAYPRVGTYANLYAALGGASSPWGQGNGSTTFNVPDLRGRVTVGAGQGSGLTNRVLAATGGEENHTLSVGEMASHSHGVNDGGHSHSVYDPQHAHSVADYGHAHSIADPQHAHPYIYGNISPQQGLTSAGPAPWYNNYSGWTGASGTGIGIYASGANVAIYGAPTNIGIYGSGANISIQNNGGNAPHQNMPPFVVINKIVKY